MSYRLLKQIQLDEIGCVLSHLEHEGCGAQILHLGNEDPENVFCLSFQTLPRRSDGAPHILEHTVLCGSEKFPVKDPFFCMIRRSLNTFMNAMTGDDITFYPAASQIKVDFYNLLDVYIDATFYPKLEPLSFLQEGHRLEFSSPQDPTSPLVHKGVVYNEMKGALASPDARGWYRLVAELYPDTPYRYNSGGDPAVIPQLTYEELREFHRTFYHPSRALFYFYGNFPLEEHLEYLETRLFSGVTRLPPLPAVPHQPRFPKPVQAQGTFPVPSGEEAQGKEMVLFGWLTASVTDAEEVLALAILDIVLMGTDASPLKMALLQSGLCTDAYAFISPDMADVPFVLVCKGARNPDAIEALMTEQLAALAQHGVPQDQIDAAIHQLEFSRTEMQSGSSPYGLKLFQRCGPLVHFGVAPELGLRIHTLFADLRYRLSQPNALGSLIRTYLLDNTHRCRLVMHPDPKQSAREAVEESEALTRLRQELAPDQVEQILAQTSLLEAFQEREDAIDVLPCIALSDVPPQPQDFSLTQSQVGPLTCFHHDCFTNGIVYAGLHFDLPTLTEEDLPYVELFASLLPEVGAGGRSYPEQLDVLLKHTGGIAADLSLNTQATNPTHFRPALTLSGKALDHNAEVLFRLFQDLLTSADFQDTDRLRQLILQMDTELENTLFSSGMRYATSLATATISPGARISDAWRGLRFFHTVRALATDLDNNLPTFQKRLQDLQTRLLQVGSGHLTLSCTEAQLERYRDAKFWGLDQLHPQDVLTWRVPLETNPPIAQGRIIPTPVAFTCQAMPTIPYSHPDSAALQLAARLLEHTTLHPLIREKGGAYGSGASYAATPGVFFLYAYRDPNLASTLSAFRQAIETVGSGDFSDEELEEAKLTFLQRADTPVSPGSRAGVAYSWWRTGKTGAMRQEYRNRLLQANREEIIAAVSRHLPTVGTVITLAGEELLQRENRKLDTPLQLSAISL